MMSHSSAVQVIESCDIHMIISYLHVELTNRSRYEMETLPMLHGA